MEPGTHPLSRDERLALLALWTIPGMGPTSIDVLSSVQGDLVSLLDVPPRQWESAMQLAGPVRERLQLRETLREIGERTEERAFKRGLQIAYPGDPAYPANMVGMKDAPCVLFHVGQPGAPRRRVAMIGSRHPDQGFLPKARRFAAEVAEAGLCIISGGAEGVDQECHFGAIAARAETWVFVGSALDALDTAQAKLLPPVLEAGGVFYSELPPGVRASKQSFPRRNRLVSGASDVLVVLRAGMKSGCWHTVLAAFEQGRPILAMPGEADNPAAAACNELLRAGKAKACLEPADVWREVGVHPEIGVKPGGATAQELAALSEDARCAYQALPRAPADFDDVRDATKLEAATLTSVLCELELLGLVVQHPGKRYERI